MRKIITGAALVLGIGLTLNPALAALSSFAPTTDTEGPNS